MNKTYDVVIVGAGVIGTSCAYHLVKKGFQVALVEKKDLARETSSHCDAVALIPDKMPGIDAAMGYASIQRFKELEKELNYDFEFHQNGSLHLCETDQEMEIATKYANDLIAEGYAIDILNPEELLEKEPFLATDLKGGLFSHECCGVNPYKLCFAFVDAVQGKGLDVYTHTTVTDIRRDADNNVVGVETDNGILKTNKVVNCCGVWAPEIGKMVGIDIPIKPRKGVILISGAGFPICKQKIHEFGYMVSKFDDIQCERDPEVEKYNVAFTIEPSAGNNVLIGSSRNFDGYDVDAEIDIIRVIAKRAVRFFPILKNINCIRSYAGVRPFIEEHLPLITHVKEIPGYYIAAGHEGDGISMAPLTGRLISEMIAGEEPCMDVTPFSFSRYK
ncbi:NAD(P)/FAD-dependent oxidoreductase [Anaerotignum sp.]|uniref:NAD(P)/FAD-dependent oxidoreductase n=1 Tax=Anaerotignum sp. TaxID=2039241 RepID=UPI00271460DE|nr:FAD-dependent oxidoreductase [Anaerotignum sp.]